MVVPQGKSRQPNDPRTRVHLAIGAIGLFIAICMIGLPAVSQDAPVAKPDAKEDFLHKKHEEHAKEKGKKWECSSCHTNATAKAEDSRPGIESHEGCNSAGCHAEDFYTAKKADKGPPMCLTCHVNNEYWKDMRELGVFPRKIYDRREYYTEFSHRQHMDPKVKYPGDQNVTCNSCHQHGGGKIAREGGGDSSNPGHENCSQCHDDKHEVPMTKCASCHVRRKEGVRTADYSLIDLKNTNKKAWAFNVRSKFSHAKHYERQGKVKDRKGNLIDIECSACHTRVAQATTVAEAVGLEARGRGRAEAHRVCATCHGTARYNGRVVFSTSDTGTNCSKCHGGFVRSYYSRKLKWE